jgi:CelD/BcsL family acetyltransferase involved in cellulose biosynthesis
MRLELINREEQFAQIGEAWNKLLNSTGIRSVFLRWEWMFTWWEQYRDRMEDPELAIIAGYEDNELVLIFPGYCEEVDSNPLVGKIRLLQFMGTRFESTDYLGVITGAQERGTRVKRVMEFLQDRLPAVDQWNLMNILEDDEIFSHVSEYVSEKQLRLARHHHRICPYIPLEGDWDSFVNGLSKNMRYNLRRRTRNLFEKNGAVFHLLEDAEQVEKTVARLFELHEKRWDTRDGTSIFQAGLRMEFHKKVARRFFDAGILRIFSIRIDGLDVAMLYCFEFANELMYFQAGFDPEWEKHSVGLVLMGKCIEYSYEKRLDIFDFMRGAEDYKYKWTSTVRNMDLITISVSKKGKRALNMAESVLKVKEAIKQRIPEETWDKMKNVIAGN